MKTFDLDSIPRPFFSWNEVKKLIGKTRKSYALFRWCCRLEEKALRNGKSFEAMFLRFRAEVALFLAYRYAIQVVSFHAYTAEHLKRLRAADWGVFLQIGRLKNDTYMSTEAWYRLQRFARVRGAVR